MVLGETIQAILSVVFFILRILIPFISIGVLVGCLISHRRGRRRDEPVVYLEDVASGLHIPVLYWENSIGRSKSCDITLPDSTISRDHAVLMRRESGWFIADTDSKGGTFVNGKKVEKEAIVMPGDIITIGGAHLSLKRVNDVDVPGELFSDSQRKAAYRAQRKKMKPAVWRNHHSSVIDSAALRRHRKTGVGTVDFPWITVGIIVGTLHFFPQSLRASQL